MNDCIWRCRCSRNNWKRGGVGYWWCIWSLVDRIRLIFGWVGWLVNV